MNSRDGIDPKDMPAMRLSNGDLRPRAMAVLMLVGFAAACATAEPGEAMHEYLATEVEQSP